MYQKYHTEALVLGSREYGEHDKVFALYTREFGLVRARASAVRKENSKQRYALQNFARIGVSLVSGKRGWRLAGAVAYEHMRSPAFARIGELSLRLVRGEEKNEYIYEALAQAHREFLEREEALHPTIEIVCVARLLFGLGYISNEALSMALFTHTAYTGESLMEAEDMKDKLLSSINSALSQTHL